MGTYGRETYEVIGSGITVTADGAPVAKAGGVTIAWAGVPAPDAGGRTFKNEDVVADGEKFLRYGTIVCRITAASDTTEIGKFMPYMSSPGGGRTLATGKGDAFILNESVHEGDRLSDHPAAIEGGRLYKRRLLVVGFGDGSSTDDDTADGAELYAGAAAENAADLAYLNITAFPSSTFLTTFPTVLFVTES